MTPEAEILKMKKWLALLAQWEKTTRTGSREDLKKCIEMRAAYYAEEINAPS